MNKIRLGADEIQTINFFEKLTGARARDIVQSENTICFLVDKEDMGLAIGKRGSNIEKVRNKLSKNIHVTEYSEDPIQLAKNIFQDAEIREARISDSGKGKNLVVKTNRKYRKNIIGLQGEKIKLARKLFERYFGLENIIIETA